MLELVFLLLILIAFGIRTSWFQTKAAQIASAYLSEEWGTDVSIDKVDIIFFDEVDIEGVYVADCRNDTLLYANLIHADIDDFSLSESYVNVSQVMLSEAYAYIKIYEGDSTLNFQHIVDYFASDEVDTTSSEPFTVRVKAIALDNINFKYRDENAEPLANGMDFSHLDFRHVSGHFSDFGMVGDSIMISIKEFQAQDRSGFALTKFSTDLLYSPNFIAADNLRITFNETYIVSDKIHLNLPNGTDDFNNFTTNVDFDANIRDTRISLADVGYFSPDLWGMNDFVYIDNIDVSRPVYGMKLKDVNIHLLDTTVIRGDFQIPNLSDFRSAFFSENLEIFRTSIADIEKLNLTPFLDSGKQHIEVPANYRKANVITLTDANFDGGIESFVVNGRLTSGLGTIYSNGGIKFELNKEDSLYHYYGGGLSEDDYQVRVKELDLAAIADNSTLGPITADLYLSGKGFAPEDLALNLSGNIHSMTLDGYNYKGIKVYGGSKFENNVFDGEIDIKDDHLALIYDGSVDLKDEMFFNFDVKIDSVHLSKLGYYSDSTYNVLKTTKIAVSIHGTSINEIHGNVSVVNLDFVDGNRQLMMDSLSLNIARHKDSDTLALYSPFMDVSLTGKYDLIDIWPVVEHQFSYVLDHLMPPNEVHESKNEFFDLTIVMKDINPLLEIAGQDIYVAENSEVKSFYSKKDKLFAFDFNIDSLKMYGIEMHDIIVKNHFDSSKASITYTADYIKLNDSIQVKNAAIDSRIKDNTFLSTVAWDGDRGTEPGLLAFKTMVNEEKDIMSIFKPSFFNLGGKIWEITPNSQITYNEDLISIKDFIVSNEGHSLSLNGKISENPDDWLDFDIKDFPLASLNDLLGGEMTLGGNLNLFGSVADLYNDIKFKALTDVTDFEINDELVGDLLINSKWVQETNSVQTNGKLSRGKKETFTFRGEYFTDREEDNIALKLDFDRTDISFVNAFSDEDLYTDIEGILDGSLDISGNISAPVVEGRLKVIGAKVHVPMFNVDFRANGPIKFGDGYIMADFFNLYDQEDNQALVNMQIYHENWADFNYDITLEMDNPAMTEKFLVMDTYYKEGDYYYGKAYITGYVNIFGYDDITNIEVNAVTQEGSDLTLPMYGSGDLEENSFITFDPCVYKPELCTLDLENGGKGKKLESSGLTLEMKFDVKDNAKMTIVFDPITGDQIVVDKGGGVITIKMDEYYEMEMFGTYTIKKGQYNMRVPGISEDFTIEEGSFVRWTQSPYDAAIDITTSFVRKGVPMNDILPPSQQSTPSIKLLTMGYVYLTNTLMEPHITFGFDVPQGNQVVKGAIEAMQSNPDELNKQFISLLVLKKFFPTEASGGGNNLATSLVESQINSTLNALSDNTNISVDLQGGAALEIDRQVGETITIYIRGGKSDSGASGEIVGDVRIEYTPNPDGTFSVNFFNESNQGTDAELGPYSQGVSVHYKETFNTTKDFQLLQKFLNIFRSEANDVKFPEKKDDKRVPLPPEDGNN